MSFYIYQSAIGGGKKEITVFVCIHGMVCGGDFSVPLQRKNIRAPFSPQFYVHVNVEFYIVDAEQYLAFYPQSCLLLMAVKAKPLFWSKKVWRSSCR